METTPKTRRGLRAAERLCELRGWQAAVFGWPLAGGGWHVYGSDERGIDKGHAVLAWVVEELRPHQGELEAEAGKFQGLAPILCFEGTPANLHPVVDEHHDLLGRLCDGYGWPDVLTIGIIRRGPLETISSSRSSGSWICAHAWGHLANAMEAGRTPAGFLPSVPPPPRLH